MALEAVQFQVEVPEVPESYSTVTRAGGEDVGRVRVEGDAVDLRTELLEASSQLQQGAYVSRVDVLGGGGGFAGVLSRVPDHQLPVPSHGAEQRVVEGMPGHVLHHCGVT